MALVRPLETLKLPKDFPTDLALVATDFDRTLIAEDGVLRPRTLRALRAAHESGLHVVVVTGRMFRSVRPHLEQAGLTDPVVCYQGAVVADPETGVFLRHVPIPIETAKEAIAAVEALRFSLNCYVDDLLYVARQTPEAGAYADFQHLEIHVVGDLLSWLEQPPTKLVVVGDPLELDALGPRLKAQFDGRLYISKSLPYFLELAHPAVTKAAGLDFLAERLGVAPEQTIAFGDGENDVELLDWAGFGVAVANAHDRVRAVADLVCPPAEEEGVAQVLEALQARDAGSAGAQSSPSQ
jgi:Cof subfamily protein (haloacid dehalogenase superfamily)